MSRTSSSTLSSRSRTEELVLDNVKDVVFDVEDELVLDVEVRVLDLVFDMRKVSSTSGTSR